MHRSIQATPIWRASSSKEQCMFSRGNRVRCGALAIFIVARAPAAWAQESKTDLFKVITVKDEIIIGLSADELKALGGSDASAVAHTLAQKGRPDGVAIQCASRPERRIAAGTDCQDRTACEFIAAG
jgi:hypothetical protein